MKQASLSEFYLNGAHVILSTGEQYTLNQLIEQSDEFWEECHNFIQWVFPNPTPSKFNPDAPLLDGYLKQVLGRYDWSDYQKGYRRFLIFLGIYWTDRNNRKLFVFNRKRFSRWFNGKDHNCLRVNRVLIFLKCIEARDDAHALFDLLYKEFKKVPTITPELKTSMNFWSEAVAT